MLPPYTHRMNKVAPHSSTIRATVLLDASTFYNLAYPVPEKFKRPGSPTPITTYLDMLPVLARNGVRILIPETVSIEIARVLSDGRSVDDLFDHPKEHKYELPFLKAVANHAFPNIEIISDTGPAEADKFCTAMHQAMDMIGIETAKGVEPENAALHARSKVVGIVRTTDRRNLGDKAILSLMDSLRGCIKSKSLFLLSEDRDLAHKLNPNANAPAICWLRFRTFMHNIASSGVASQVGLKPNIDADDIAKDACHQHHPDPKEYARFSREFEGKATAELLLDMPRRSSNFLDILRTVRQQALLAPSSSATDRGTLLAKFGGGPGESSQGR